MNEFNEWICGKGIVLNEEGENGEGFGMGWRGLAISGTGVI